METASSHTIPAGNDTVTSTKTNWGFGKRSDSALPKSLETRIQQIMNIPNLDPHQQSKMIENVSNIYYGEKGAGTQALEILIVGCAWGSVVVLTLAGIIYVSKLLAPQLPLGDGVEFPDA